MILADCQDKAFGALASMQSPSQVNIERGPLATAQVARTR
jgi:hypothetical protein